MITFDNGAHFAYDMIGEFHSAGEWLHQRRTIDSYELILVLEGTVYLAEESQEYALQKNELLLLEPHREHYGTRTVSAPTAFYWFHYFTDLPLPLKHFDGEDVHELRRLMKQLLHRTNTPTDSPRAADAAGYLIFEELVRLARERETSNRALSAKLTEYVRNAPDVTVAELARRLGYNADYLGKYFKKTHGIGLKEYLTAERLKLARDLLLTTGLSVKQIARESGFRDENLFIKFFTYHEALSPTAFRNKYSNTHINHK